MVRSGSRMMVRPPSLNSRRSPRKSCIRRNGWPCADCGARPAPTAAGAIGAACCCGRCRDAGARQRRALRIGCDARGGGRGGSRRRCRCRRGRRRGCGWRLGGRCLRSRRRCDRTSRDGRRLSLRSGWCGLRCGLRGRRCNRFTGNGRRLALRGRRSRSRRLCGRRRDRFARNGRRLTLRGGRRDRPAG